MIEQSHAPTRQSLVPSPSLSSFPHPGRRRRRRRRRCCCCPCSHKALAERQIDFSLVVILSLPLVSAHSRFSKQPQSPQPSYRQQPTSTLLQQPQLSQRMPLLNTRHVHHHSPLSQNRPTNHRAQHTQWHPHNLIHGAMNSPLSECLTSHPYWFPTIPSPYYDALTVVLTIHGQYWVLSCSLRLSPCFSVGGACGIGSAASLARQSRPRTHLVCTSTSTDMVSLQQMTTFPSRTRPCPQCRPPSAHPHSILRECSSSSHCSIYLCSSTRTPIINDPPPMNRPLHIDATRSRPSTVQITHFPTPPKMNDAKSTSRGGLTSITFYPDSPTGSSAPSTPALSECDGLSPRSETMLLTPRLSFEEGVKVVPPSPSPSVFSSSTFLDSFRIQAPPFSVQGHKFKPAPSSIPDVPAITEPVARPSSPTMMISIHTTLPSHMIARARPGSTAPVPPNIVLTSVPRRPSQPEAPLSPPHMLTVPSTKSVRKQRPQQPSRRPITLPPAYDAPKSIVDVWTLPTPATAPDPPRGRHHTRQHTLKRLPPPPPKPIIPLDLDPVYPSKDKEAEVTPMPNPGPAFALRRPPPPPVKPVVPFELEPVYPEEKSEKSQIRYSQYDDREDDEVESPTSATMFFKALVEKGKREMQSLRKEMGENAREESKWGGMSIGARMSAFAKRAKRAVERELDSEDEGEVIALSPGSPVPRSGWPSSIVSTPKPQGVVMPLNASEVRKEREVVFIIGDEEDF